MTFNQWACSPLSRAELKSWISHGKLSRTVLILLCLLAAILISLIVSIHLLPFVIDDALISYRYSDRLLHGKGLTWNDGEFVEGYSNLLWVLVVATGGLIQPNLVLVGWVLGLIANITTLASIAWAFGRSPKTSIFAVIGGLLFIACSECFAFWGIAGMETALLNALLSWALVLAYRLPADSTFLTELRPSVLFGLLAITRPDGVLFGVAAGIGELIRNGGTRISIRRSIAFAGAAIAFMAVQIAFRLAYYGSLVPNTSFAKLAFNFERILDGGAYVGTGAMVNGALLVTIATTMIVLWRSHRWQPFRQNAIFVMPGLVWLGYVCAIGGDWFPFERQWQPALICFTLAASGLLSMLSPVRAPRLALLAVVVVVLDVAAQATRNPYVPVFNQTTKFMETLRSDLKRADPSGRAEREFLSAALASREDSLRDYHGEYQECIALGRLLHTAFNASRPLIAVGGAGCLPFRSELPALDMFGLNDAYIAHHPPPDMGHGPIGHELGDGGYVLSRKPDLIIFCGFGYLFGVSVPCSRSERQIAGSREFVKNYRLTLYRADEFEMQAWTRIEDGRLGIERVADRIYIPGFLLATTSGARGVLDSKGKLVATLRDGDARIENVDLPPGTWEVSLETDGVSHLELATVPPSRGRKLGPGTLRIASVGGPQSLRVFGARGLIYAVIARRVQDD
jgi:arabinofuranosyltransferase